LFSLLPYEVPPPLYYLYSKKRTLPIPPFPPFLDDELKTATSTSHSPKGKPLSLLMGGGVFFPLLNEKTCLFFGPAALRQFRRSHSKTVRFRDVVLSFLRGSPIFFLFFSARSEPFCGFETLLIRKIGGVWWGLWGFVFDNPLIFDDEIRVPPIPLFRSVGLFTLPSKVVDLH